MNPTNQMSMVLENELNNAPSAFPVNVKTIHKLKLFAPSGKVNAIYTFAGYTYGPLLGLFAFGLFTKFAVKDNYVWIVAVLSPVICYFINTNSEFLFNGYKFGFELMILNGALTFAGLFILRKK